jgi:hypothetical protein
LGCAHTGVAARHDPINNARRFLKLIELFFITSHRVILGLAAIVIALSLFAIYFIQTIRLKAKSPV